MSMRLRFWGVRGSIACPSPEHVRYGGNTSCLELEAGGHTLILDAGIRLRELLGRFDGEVGFVGPDGEEERLVRVALLQPADALFGDERGGEAFDLADGVAVADEVGWVFVVR